MLDQKVCGEKLRGHRKNLGLTQEEVADIIGVSAQAISKWEAGECMPDACNLKAISDVYHISLDILLETTETDNADAVAEKIEQLGDECIWAKQNRAIPHIHRDLGEDLWKFWKGLYFIEAGDKAVQKSEKNRGNLRICSDYGLKIWDEDGIACIIRSSLREKYTGIAEETREVLTALCSEDGLTLIAALDAQAPIGKQALLEKTGLALHRLNELLLLLSEHQVITFVGSAGSGGPGYKICAYYGIAAYMTLAAAYILGKPQCTVSEYFPKD